jgi:hypothetical protein
LARKSIARRTSDIGALVRGRPGNLKRWNLRAFVHAARLGTRAAYGLVISMTRTSLFSTLGVLVAAVASVATSAPDPDWELDDSAEGEITLDPQIEETTLKLHVTSEVVGSTLSFETSLDPTPQRGADLAATPVVMFVARPTEVGASTPSGLTALPQSAGVEGYDQVTSSAVTAKEGARELDVRFVWTSPSDYDRTEYRTTPLSGSSGYVTEPVVRPLAPRQKTTIKWRAKIHADGYDDRPRGAKVDIAAAQ